MLKSTMRTQAWLADLAGIVIEIEAVEVRSPRLVRRRKRKLKPLWEE